MEEKLAKLKRLLATSTAFSSIIAERIKTQKQQRAAAMKAAEKEAAATPVRNANGKRGQKSNATTSAGSPSKRVKVDDGEAAAAEHAPETEDESKRVKVNEEILYMKQPESVTGATLRDYQLAGVQWLTLLYENGVFTYVVALHLVSDFYLRSEWHPCGRDGSREDASDDCLPCTSEGERCMGSGEHMGDFDPHRASN